MQGVGGNSRPALPSGVGGRGSNYNGSGGRGPPQNPDRRMLPRDATMPPIRCIGCGELGHKQQNCLVRPRECRANVRGEICLALHWNGCHAGEYGEAWKNKVHNQMVAARRPQQRTGVGYSATTEESGTTNLLANAFIAVEEAPVSVAANDDALKTAVAYRAVAEVAVPVARQWVKVLEASRESAALGSPTTRQYSPTMKDDSGSEETVDVLLSTSRPLTPEVCCCKQGFHDTLVKCDACTQYDGIGLVAVQRWQCTACNDYEGNSDIDGADRQRCLCKMLALLLNPPLIEETDSENELSTWFGAKAQRLARSKVQRVEASPKVMITQCDGRSFYAEAHVASKCALRVLGQPGAVDQRRFKMGMSDVNSIDVPTFTAWHIAAGVSMSDASKMTRVLQLEQEKHETHTELLLCMKEQYAVRLYFRQRMGLCVQALNELSYGVGVLREGEDVSLSEHDFESFAAAANVRYYRGAVRLMNQGGLASASYVLNEYPRPSRLLRDSEYEYENGVHASTTLPRPMQAVLAAENETWTECCQVGIFEARLSEIFSAIDHELIEIAVGGASSGEVAVSALLIMTNEVEMFYNRRGNPTTRDYLENQSMSQKCACVHGCTKKIDELNTPVVYAVHAGRWSHSLRRQKRMRLASGHARTA